MLIEMANNTKVGNTPSTMKSVLIYHFPGTIMSINTMYMLFFLAHNSKVNDKASSSLSPTERTPIVIQLSVRSRKELWE